MSTSPALAVQLRRRVGRVFRRAEVHPDRRASILAEEVGRLQPELRRLAESEPWVVAETLLSLLERLPPLLLGADDPVSPVAGLPLSLFEELLQVVRRIVAIGESDEVLAPLISRLLLIWDEDAAGSLAKGDAALLKLSEEAAARRLLIELWKRELAARPLYFPVRQGAPHELSRSLEFAARHRADHLLGELLALDGRPEYAVHVAREHWQRTGDAYDLAASLRRAGRHAEALAVARKALASARTHRRDDLQALVELLLLSAPATPDRTSKRELETLLFDHPSRASLAALERSVPKEQWPRVRARVLAHLQKHQRAPALVFELLLEVDDLIEADGLVVTQVIPADTLERGAERIAAVRPDLAAGWFLVAAHRRADQGRSTEDNAILRNLGRVRELAAVAGKVAAFPAAVQRFCARHPLRKKLCARLRALID